MRQSTILLLASLALLSGACDDSSTGLPDVTLAVVSGSGQAGGFAADLADPVAVRVLDGAGSPVVGEVVTWHVVAGGGRTDSVFTTTDATGVARVRWTLGSDEGTHMLVASARNASISVTATGRFEFASVSVGYRHACALSTTGEAFCWGLNSSAQLGDGTETSRTIPTRVIGSKRFASISAGWAHTCGVTSGGQVFCWGDNGSGQLGVASTIPRSHGPSQAAATVSFKDVSAGFVHTCAIAADGAAYCWGSNGQRQLGTGTAANSSLPVAVASEARFRQVEAGEFHSCAVATDSSVYCWGSNSTGELGVGIPFGETRNAPTRVNAINGIDRVATGARHTCAVGAAVYCWGRNALGEIGLPPLNHSGLPVAVPTTRIFTMISAGNVLSCGSNRQDAYCWGGDAFSSSITPELRFTGPVASLDLGFEEACVVSTGDIYCWGLTSREPLKIERPK